MDYAIVRTGGKQYRVSPGDVLDVELLEAEEGSATTLDQVLAVSRDGQMRFGAPTVAGARVIAEVQSHYKDRKIIVYKYKAKTRYRRKKGHRQNYTRILIQDIDAPDVDTQNIDTTDVDTQNIDTTDIDTQNIDAPDVDTQNIDTPDVDTQNIDTTDIDTQNIDAPDVDTGGAPQAATEPETGE